MIELIATFALPFFGILTIIFGLYIAFLVFLPSTFDEEARTEKSLREGVKTFFVFLCITIAALIAKNS